MINRTVFLTSLARKYNLAFDNAISALTTHEKIDITETLLQLTELYKDFQGNQEKVKTINSTLLNKYRKKLKPLIDADLYVYFDRESVLMVKGIDAADKYFFTDEEFNNLNPEEQVLSDQEYEHYIQRINNHMAKERQEFYLSMEPENANESVKGNEKPDAAAPTTAPSATPNTAAKASPNSDDDEFITSKEAAALLKVSKVTLHKWKLEGKIKFYRFGTRVRFKKSEVVKGMRGGNK